MQGRMAKSVAASGFVIVLAVLGLAGCGVFEDSEDEESPTALLPGAPGAPSSGGAVPGGTAHGQPGEAPAAPTSKNSKDPKDPKDPLKERAPNPEALVAFARTLVGQQTYTSASLVQAIFAHEKVDLPATVALQAQAGVPADVAQLKPADLVFSQSGRDATVNHVQMFLGNGELIHATEECDAKAGRKGDDDDEQRPAKGCVVEVVKLDKKLEDKVAMARDVLP